MIVAKIGERVGAILSANAQEVNLLGYGTYVGDEVPPMQVDPLLSQMGFPNPKIELDNGEVVWGCQCWWGPEASVKARVEVAVKAGAVAREVKVTDE